MKNLMVFGASNSSKSINKRLAHFVSKQIKGAEINLLDLNDFEMPIYSQDREEDSGIPQKAHDFKKHIKEADGIIMSFAEHNGSYTVAFKNIYDWVSRIEKSVWLDKPLFLLATSEGGLGAQFVLKAAYDRFHHGYGNRIIQFSLPKFSENFDDERGFKNEAFSNEFEIKLKAFIG